MPENPLVSVIIVSFNDEELLSKLLLSLWNQGYRNYEVVIIDNASNQAVEKLAKHVRARYHSTGSNLGYTGGNNLGASQAKGDLILILNPDTWLMPDSLRRMVQELSKRGPRCAVVVPKVLIKDTEKINSVGMRRFHRYANLYANVGHLETDHGQYDQPSRAEAFDGAAFMIRKSLLKETYLFDPFYFGGEDGTDLAERISKLGYEIWTCPTAVVRHEIHATFGHDPLGVEVRPTLIRNNLAHTITNRGVRFTLLTVLVFAHFSLVQLRQRHILVAQHYTRGVITFLVNVGRIMISTHALREQLKRT